VPGGEGIGGGSFKKGVGVEFWPSCGDWRLVSSLPLSMPQCCLTLLLSASGKCGESEGKGGVNGGKGEQRWWWVVHCCFSEMFAKGIVCACLCV